MTNEGELLADYVPGDAQNDGSLIGDPDAKHWARRFVTVHHNVLTGPDHCDIATDEDTMATWFASAIETGRMAADREAGREQPQAVAR